MYSCKMCNLIYAYTCNIKVLNARANRIDREYISSVLKYLVVFYRRQETETQRKDIMKTVSNIKLFIVYM